MNGLDLQILGFWLIIPKKISPDTAKKLQHNQFIKLLQQNKTKQKKKKKNNYLEGK